MAGEKQEYQIEIVNRKAKFLYHFVQSFEAGVMLSGTEIKSIRMGNANLTDAYCVVNKGEVFIKSMYISVYKQGGHHNHEPRRTRKLLLGKGEIKKITRRLQEKGQALIPYRLYINARGLAKLEIALASGKKSFDKRHSIKEKDQKRDLDRSMKLK